MIKIKRKIIILISAVIIAAILGYVAVNISGLIEFDNGKGSSVRGENNG